jgi:hypothetical protein
LPASAGQMSTMGQTKQDREQNKRTGLVLASIALVFFIGIVAKYWLLK